MKVTLLHHSPLEVIVKAIRKCYASEGKSDSHYVLDADMGNYDLYILYPKDKALIKRIIESDHTSTLEHLAFTFDIDELSRAALQELSRHRVTSLSVQSTRYTLRKLFSHEDLRTLLVPTGDALVDESNYLQLMDLKHSTDGVYEQDKVKYMLPEAFKTSLIWTINARSLRNFLKLRSSKRALWEMRELAEKVFEKIPGDMKFIFDECME